MTEPENQCTLCERRNVPNVVAVTWCTVCEEALCESCDGVHRLLKASCNHQTTNFDDYKKFTPFLSSLKLNCEKHNEPFALFCPGHKEPCCRNCVTTKHKTCHGFKTLENLIKESSSTNILDLECAIDELNINVEKVLTNRKDALKTLDDQILDLAAKIKETRHQINELLDRNEKEILHQLSTIHTNQKTEIENVIEVLKSTKSTISTMYRNIEDMKAFSSDSHIFFGSRLLMATLHDESQNFRKLFINESMLKQKRVDLSFSPATLLLGNDHAFGKLEVTEAENEIMFTKNASLEAELSVDALTNIEAIQLRTNVQFQMDNGSFTRRLAGCTFLGKDRLLFADWSDNNELLFFDEKGTDLKNIRLDKKAFDVCYIGDNCVAVTFPDTRQLSILDLKSRQEKVVVTFENRCWGVTFSGGKLFVREYSVGIHCLDMTGKILKTIPVDGYITHITSYNGKLYFTEHTPDAVHCCDEDGAEIWHLPLEGTVAPKGIVVGQFGFVFVVLENEQKLLVISPNGSTFREILNAENGLKEPHAINYDMVRNKLLLVKDKTGIAELYDVLY